MPSFHEPTGYHCSSTSDQCMLGNLRVVPAVIATLVQLTSLLILFALFFAITFIAKKHFNLEFDFPVFVLFLLQSLLSTVISSLVRMPKWWLWIHFFFPLAIFLMLQWNIPNQIYLFGFLVFLSLFWTTFRTQVPFYPSRPIVWEQVLNFLPQKQNETLRVVDIGSGLGDMSMYIAHMRPDVLVEGIEIAPLPWLISFLRAKYRRSSAVFSLGNYQQLNFANYDVVFAYLSPAVMSELWKKSKSEMRKDSLLISYEFEISDVVPTQVILMHENKPKLYVWNMSGN